MDFTHSPELDKLATALTAVQATGLVALKESRNTHLNAEYASILSVWESVRGKLAEHGLSFSQFPGTMRETGANTLPCLSVTNLLMHSSGQFISGKMEMPVSPHKGLNPAQCFGLVLTYARRYGMLAVLGIATGDDDDAQRAFPRRENEPPPPDMSWQEMYDAKAWQAAEAPGDDSWRTLGELNNKELWQQIMGNKANGFGNVQLVAASAHLLYAAAKERDLSIPKALESAKWQGPMGLAEMDAATLYDACKVVGSLPKPEPKENSL